MQRIAEQKLSSIHYTGEKNLWKPRTIKTIISIALVCVLPFLHIGVASHWIWPGKPSVDRFACTCSCFDTIFRGAYETQPSGYKHIYFNATEQTLKIWVLTVSAIIAAYECCRYLVTLLMENNCRRDMLLLVVLSVYPHYYSWWNYLNYYNEDFYDQWTHQMFFTITEILSTCSVLYLCKRTHELNTFCLLSILTISAAHIVIGGIDQFVENIFYGKGWRFQVLRDLGLVIADIAGVSVAAVKLRELAKIKKTSLGSMFYKEEIMAAMLTAVLMIVVGRSL